MKTNRYIVVLVVLFLALSTADADKMESKIDADEINSLSEPMSAGDLAEEEMLKYIDRSSIVLGEMKDGRVYFMAKSTVSVKHTNSQWGKYRALAYDNALLKAQKEFVKFYFQDLMSEIERTVFDDQSDDAIDIKKDKRIEGIENLYNKITALAGAKLDHALEEAGVDPQKFNTIPKDKKKVYFKDNLLKKALTKSQGKLSGLITVQTTEGKSKNGEYAISVLVLYSDKLKQIADDISRRKRPLLRKNSSKDIKDYIPTDKKILSDTFGIRVVFQKDGTPALVSFSQWSHSYTGKNEKKLERRRESALKTATIFADAQIADFLNARINATESKTVNAISEEAVKLSGEDGIISPDDVEKIVDITREYAKRRSHAKLRGIKTAKRWRLKHESGNEIIGVVRVWTYGGASMARDIGKSKQHTLPTNVKSKSHQTTEGSSIGADMMDVHDF